MLLTLPPLTVDVATGVVTTPSGTTSLRPREAELLGWLADRVGTTCTRAEVLAGVWGYGPRVVSRTLDTTLSRLRAKIEPDPKNPTYLVTVPGQGIRLEIPATPREPTVGRDVELRALSQALQHHALVTLVGMGGAGKTHLARRICTARGGVFCDVSACQGEVDLTRAIGQALHEGWEPDRPGPTALGEALHLAAPDLLVVDNVEQVLDAWAPLCTAMLDARPTLHILATSRMPLHIGPEHVVTLAGLRPEDALTLYELRSGRSLAADDQEDLVDLLGLVDHLPLAVEMVAAWEGLVPFSELAARVRRGVDVLVSERRDIPARHRSLGRIVQDTVAFLPEDTAAALSALTLFAADFSLADAEAIVGPAAPLHVRRLARAGLVTRVDGGFRMRRLVRGLAWTEPDPDRLRALARHLAGTGQGEPHPEDLAAAARACIDADDFDTATKCASRMARVPGSELADCLAVFDAVSTRTGGATAHQAALDAARLLWRRGKYADARRRIGPLLDVGPTDAATRARARMTAAVIERDGGAPAKALALLEEAEAIAAEAGLGALHGRALAERGFVLGRMGHTDKAATAAQAAVDVLRGEDDPASLAYALRIRGTMKRETGRRAAHLEEALAIYRRIGDRRSEGIVLGATAIQHMDEGRYAEARRVCEEAVDLLTRVGAAHLAAVFRANWAFICRIEGANEAATRGYEEALAVIRAYGDPTHEALALGNLGEIRAEAGDLRGGVDLLDQAVRTTERVQFAKLHGLFSASAGLARVRLGEVATGLAALERAEQTLRAGKFPDALCKVLATRALAAVALGDLDAAEQFIAASKATSPNLVWVDRFWQQAAEQVALARATTPRPC